LKKRYAAEGKEGVEKFLAKLIEADSEVEGGIKSVKVAKVVGGEKVFKKLDGPVDKSGIEKFIEANATLKDTE